MYLLKLLSNVQRTGFTYRIIAQNIDLSRALYEIIIVDSKLVFLVCKYYGVYFSLSPTLLSDVRLDRCFQI